MNGPVIELSEEFFSDATAIEPMDGFDIEDSNFKGISTDLCVSASSFGHIFIEAESSREFELTQDGWEIVFRSEMFLSSIRGRFRPSSIKAPGGPPGDPVQGTIILDDPSHGF
jgi:hypothetical protein